MEPQSREAKRPRQEHRGSAPDESVAVEPKEPVTSGTPCGADVAKDAADGRHFNVNLLFGVDFLEFVQLLQHV